MDPTTRNRNCFFESPSFTSFTQQRLGLAATITGLPPVQVLLSQMPPDDFFANSKGTRTEVAINKSKNTQ
jgi:hypothetical protein